MKVSWMPTPVIRRLKEIPLARKAIYYARGEQRSFQDKIDFSETPPLNHKIYIGTHHKTGTVWLGRVFSTFAFTSRSTLEHKSTGSLVRRPRHHLILDHHASTDNIDLSECRGFRMVRDPRDLIVSAMLYHRRSDEAWLHKPKSDGRTYQEQINELDDEDAILFEMDNFSGKVIRQMLAFDGKESIKTIHYEDYLHDADMVMWHPLFRWMGLSSIDLLLAQQALYERSLFGMAGKGTSHISSGRKKGWQSYFTPRVQEHFDTLFEDAPARLGYRN